MSCDTDHYLEGPYMVFTERHHILRGYCCGSRCRHCPFSPRYEKGGRTLQEPIPSPCGGP
jgi:hypothetical protein